MTEGNINSCFNTDFSISDILPTNPTHIPIGTRELIFATKDYLDNRFRGIMRVNIIDIKDKYLMVCPDYFAYFFRTLLSDIYGRAFLNIEFSVNKDKIQIIADWENFELSDSQTRNLIRIARNAGFEIYPNEKCIKLSAECLESVVTQIYAISPDKGYSTILESICIIFGETYKPRKSTKVRK